MNAPHLKLVPLAHESAPDRVAILVDAKKECPSCLKGADTSEPDLAPLLAGSLELLAAIERIREVACHELPHGTLDVCGEPLDTRCCMADRFEDHGRDCVLVYALEVGTVVYARTLEDAACELLLHCDPEQRQDRATVARVVGMIEASFARARAAAKGGGR
jgi:hypothetical protein